MHDDFYQMYLEELEVITPCTVDEAQVLAEKVLAKDETARTRLIEGELHKALAFAKEYEGKGLLIGDLIQEANVALTMAAGSFPGGSWREFVENMIREAIEAAMGEQTTEAHTKEEVVARVNVLKEVSQYMAEELGREATVEELADRMKMTTDEIKAIMKITLNALSINPES